MFTNAFVRGTAFIAALALLGSTARSFVPEDDGTRPSFDPVERFLSRPEEPLSQYRAWRLLYGKNERFNREGWMEVWTERDPDDRLRYEVIDEGGSEYILNRVLRRVLEGERDSSEAGDAAAALTSDNYDFTDAGSDSDGLLKVAIAPRRREVVLVSGVLFLTPDDLELVRLEGSPARSPSFWTRHVEMTREYERLAGVRVLREVRWRSQVRVAGPSEFVMSYVYETVNGLSVATNTELEARIAASRQAAERVWPDASAKQDGES